MSITWLKLLVKPNNSTGCFYYISDLGNRKVGTFRGSSDLKTKLNVEETVFWYSLLFALIRCIFTFT